MLSPDIFVYKYLCCWALPPARRLIAPSLLVNFWSISRCLGTGTVVYTGSGNLLIDQYSQYIRQYIISCVHTPKKARHNKVRKPTKCVSGGECREERQRYTALQSSILIGFNDSVIATDRASQCPSPTAVATALRGSRCEATREECQVPSYQFVERGRAASSATIHPYVAFFFFFFILRRIGKNKA